MVQAPVELPVRAGARVQEVVLAQEAVPVLVVAQVEVLVLIGALVPGEAQTSVEA